MSALRLARGFTGTRQDREDRRRLSRPRGLLPGRGRLRRGHARHPWLGRRPRRRGARHDRGAVQRSRRGRARVRDRRGRRGDHRADRRQHGPRAARPRLPRRAARDHQEARRAAHLRRGDQRLSLSRSAAPRRCYGVTPDLTCLGKIVGGGLPAAAFGGRADIMQKLAPLGPVYQAGTLSGTRSRWRPGSRLHGDPRPAPARTSASSSSAAKLGDGLARRGRRRQGPGPGQPGRLDGHDVLHRTPVTDYASAKTSDTGGSAASSATCEKRGVFLPPSQFEAMFVSLAHTDEDHRPGDRRGAQPP